MGSKNRIAKEILSIMLKYRKPGQWWVEPFVGGGNIIDKVTGNRIGCDVDKDVISALETIAYRTELLPKNNKEFTEKDYYKIKKCPNHPLYGYVAFALSYGGKKWGGWRRDKEGKRDYVAEAYRSALKQSKKLQGVLFFVCSYEEIPLLPPNSIIYCDPPYKDTTEYSKKFDYNEFWKWCEEKYKEGHYVFVSEYSAPKGWKAVWQKEIVSSLTKNTGAKKSVEKLFVPKSFKE